MLNKYFGRKEESNKELNTTNEEVDGTEAIAYISAVLNGGEMKADGEEVTLDL